MLKFDNGNSDRREKNISCLFSEMSDNTNKIVVITGSNGAGKSHVKKMIQSESSYYKYWKRQPYSYCSEQDNLRTNKTKDHVDGVLRNSIYRIMFISRGQTTLLDLSEVTSFKDSNILLDEPEAGISLDNYNLLYNILNTASKHSKIYCFTNSPYICLMANTIYKVSKSKVTLVKDLEKFKQGCKKQILNTINLLNKDINELI